MTTVRRLIEATTATFLEAGIVNARWDAELLIAHGLQKSRLELYAHPEYQINNREHMELSRLVNQRANRKPLQYLVGHQEFWGMSFKVTPDVLIPRHETELVVETAIAICKTWPHWRTPVLADIGTGSGCLAVSLSEEVQTAEVYATDISARALSIARENAIVNGQSGRIQFLQGDLCCPLYRAGLAGCIDLVVSNLPYIPRSSFSELVPEVHDYEPRIALDGGEKGLEPYDRLLGELKGLLSPRGIVILEMGDQQSNELEGLAVRSGFGLRNTMNDLSGIPRVMILESS